MEKIIILGSTGSIGQQTLEIINEFNDFEVLALSCGYNIELLKAQIIKFKPKYVSTIERQVKLEEEFEDITFYYGNEGLVKIASLDENATLLNALVGSSGLEPTLAAIKTHKKVLLSNKETLVIGGELVKEYLSKYNGTLYPVDSEHSGLWELIDEFGRENIKEYTITASGGAFRDKTIEEMKTLKAVDALKHPNWSMGKKITIDSATMMNKGFEVIEAHYLFDIDYDKISTIIQRDSLVHACVTLNNGEEKMTIGSASMRNPIIRALYYPLIKYSNKQFDTSKLSFEKVDYEKFPCLNLSIEMAKKGGLYPTILNAANEIAVKLYLEDKITFLDIYKINYEMCMKNDGGNSVTLENILKYDRLIKDLTMHLYGGRR